MRCPTSGPGDARGCYADGTLVHALRVLADAYLWQRIHANAINPDEDHRFLPRRTFGLAGVGEPCVWSDDGEVCWNESIDIFTDGGAHAVDEEGKWIGWDLSFLKDKTT